MHVHRLLPANRHAPAVAERPSPSPAPVAQARPAAPAAFRPWLAQKVVDALEYRAAQKLGAVPRGGLQGPTVAEAVGLWAAAKGCSTLRLALHVPPPEGEFLA